MAVVYEDECVGCPQEMGCFGSACPNKNAAHYYCDECRDEVEMLYEYDNGRELCEKCLLKQFKVVE